MGASVLILLGVISFLKSFMELAEQIRYSERNKENELKQYVIKELIGKNIYIYI